MMYGDDDLLLFKLDLVSYAWNAYLLLTRTVTPPRGPIMVLNAEWDTREEEIRLFSRIFEFRYREGERRLGA